jgi:DNA (cytosine-5)-methyltransferase 1
MGLSLAGFGAAAVVERDRWCCDTIRENQARGFPVVADWPLHEADVRDFVRETLPRDGIDLVAGGPPCQPFSMGGKHKANLDERDMFPVTVDVIRRLKPRAFIVENVKGLTRQAFANYYQYTLLQMEFPEIVKGEREEWEDHFHRLQAAKSSRGRAHGLGLTYNVLPTLVNAADYGVPQKRERVFIVGFRSDLGVEWSFPDPTHSFDSLLFDQYVTGDYWERHRVAKRLRPEAPSRALARIEKLRQANEPLSAKPWKTTRDVLAGLPDPETGAGGFHNHRFVAGARSYPGHTGSPLDLPAKTLKAGDHGVPGGENMMVKDNGSVRYFTVREAARLQTFPDGYIFHGSWTETMRQLGNAVPVALATLVASSVAEKLAAHEIERMAVESGRGWRQ